MMSFNGVKKFGTSYMTSTHIVFHLQAIGLALTTLVPSVNAQICYCYRGEYCLNQKCEKCPSGTYQPEVDYNIQSCTPWTEKGRGWVVETEGTNQTDTIWKCAEGFYMVNNTECREKDTKLRPVIPDWLVAVIVLVALVLIIIIVVICFLRYKKLFCFSSLHNVQKGAQNNGNIPQNIEMGPVNANNAATNGQLDNVHISPQDEHISEQEKLLNNDVEIVETPASTSNLTTSKHQRNCSQENTFENLYKAVSIPYSLNGKTSYSVEDEPSAKKDLSAKEEPSADKDLRAREESSVTKDLGTKDGPRAKKDSSTNEESSAKRNLYAKKSSENYAALLHGLFQTIEKLMKSPQDFTTFCSVYLVFDREDKTTDLVKSYLQWASQNPKHNFAWDFRVALESFGYTLPDQKNDADLDVVGGIEDLKNAVDKKILLKQAFRELCDKLCSDLGEDVLILLDHLIIVHPGKISKKYTIPPLVDWALRGALPENGTWCILEELKRVLKDMKRNDIVAKFDVLAQPVILKCQT